MIEKLFTDSPLAFIVLICSIVGSGYVVKYRLDSMEANSIHIAKQINRFGDELDEFEDNMREDVDELEDEMTKQITELNINVNQELSETNTRVALLEQQSGKKRG